MSAVGVSSRGALCKLCGVSRGLGLTPAPRQPERDWGSRPRRKRGGPGQDLAERREICLAHPQEPPVAHGCKRPRAEPILHGALADAEELGDFFGGIEWTHDGRVRGVDGCWVSIHRTSLARGWCHGDVSSNLGHSTARPSPAL